MHKRGTFSGKARMITKKEGKYRKLSMISPQKNAKHHTTLLVFFLSTKIEDVVFCYVIGLFFHLPKEVQTPLFLLLQHCFFAPSPHFLVNSVPNTPINHSVSQPYNEFCEGCESKKYCFAGAHARARVLDVRR